MRTIRDFKLHPKRNDPTDEDHSETYIFAIKGGEFHNSHLRAPTEW